MSTKNRLLVSVAILAIAVVTVFNLPEKQVAKFKKLPKMDRIDLAMEQEYMMTKDPATGTIPRERLIEAARIRDQRLQAMAGSRAVAGLAWQERGPSNVGGRTRAVLYDANDAANGYKKVWAGSVSGGLWYTNDITVAQPQWHRVNDFLGNIAITTIAQNPGNPQELYVGTGEGWFNLDFVRGLGIWKSSDGGVTWAQLASTNNLNFHYVQKIVVTSTGIVLAATRGGVRRSIDGGVNFNKVLGAMGFGALNDRAADLEIAADGRIYASIGIFTTDGIYRSADDGASWTNIYTSSSDEERIELATAPSDANIVYALVHGVDGSNGISGDGDDDGIKKIMRTTNATVVTPTWNTLTLPGWCDQSFASTDFTRNQAWYDLIAAVDPADANTVYIGGIDVLKTTNGGTSWTQISQWSTGCTSGSYVHADIHSMAFKPGSSSELTIGCDGGIFRTADAGANFAHRNWGYNVTQYYATAAHPTLTNYFLAGAQDNGTQKYSIAGINPTVMATGGDGGFCHIDQDAPSTQITAYVFNSYFLSTDGGATWASRNLNGNGQFINPTDLDNTANILYCGNTSGTYLRWSSPYNAVGSTSTASVLAFGGAAVTHITVSPLTANRVYFGLANGRVVRVDGANVGAAPVGVIMHTGTGAVSSIAIDPADENHMLVTYSSYGVANVYESFDATVAVPTFTSVDGDLPDMPVRWAMFDPRNSDWALLATELGVWSTDNLDAAGTTNWNPTNASLANVRVDMLQYRANDRTIVAATHGRGLFTAIVPATITEAVRFSAPTAVLPEQHAGASDCRTYKDYIVNMVVEAPVTTASAITVGIAGGATATNGVDYAFTTNGNFATPSTTVNFAAGSTTAQDITIRVYDDQNVEATESFTLNFTINSGSAIAGSSNQTHAVTITDDDKAPTGPSVISAGIGSADANVSQPFRGGFHDARTQMVYTAAELNSAGFRRGSITQLRFNVISKTSTIPYNNFTVRLKNTTNDSLRAGNVFETGGTTVFGPVAYSTAAGVNNINLSTPFEWDGVSNLLVDICFDNAAASGNDLIAATLGQNRTQFERNDAAVGCGFTVAPFSFGGGARPDIGITMTATATPVETVLNATRTVYMGANADVYVYSTTDGELLARVRNLSAHDYGCTQVVVDRAGTGAQPFWNNNPPNYLMDKTFRLIPTTNNPTGTFEVTLYFTPAEVAGWESATGQVFSNIELVKVQGQILQVTPATPAGAGTVEVVTPTRSTLGTNSTLTYTFNTGMGGLGAGIPGIQPLPVTLLNFSGQLQQQNVSLQWTTANEHNNRGFEIERSYDGVRFTKIGFVPSAVNSSTVRNYTFRDPQKASEYNYYRLRIVDLDNSFDYSNIILVKNPSVLQQVFVMGNPFRNDIELRFARAPKGRVAVRLYDIKGSLILSQEFSQVSQTLNVKTSGKHLPGGTYVLNLDAEGVRYTYKLLKN